MTQLPLTNDAVAEAVNHLLDTTGPTTSLDVKNYLRGQGYFATQDDVSARMRTLATHEGWSSFPVQGGWRLYTRPQPVDPATDPAQALLNMSGSNTD